MCLSFYVSSRSHFFHSLTMLVWCLQLYIIHTPCPRISLMSALNSFVWMASSLKVQIPLTSIILSHSNSHFSFLVSSLHEDAAELIDSYGFSVCWTHQASQRVKCAATCMDKLCSVPCIYIQEMEDNWNDMMCNNIHNILLIELYTILGKKWSWYRNFKFAQQFNCSGVGRTNYNAVLNSANSSCVNSRVRVWMLHTHFIQLADTTDLFIFRGLSRGKGENGIVVGFDKAQMGSRTPMTKMLPVL